MKEEFEFFSAMALLIQTLPKRLRTAHAEEARKSIDRAHMLKKLTDDERQKILSLLPHVPHA